VAYLYVQNIDGTLGARLGRRRINLQPVNSPSIVRSESVSSSRRSSGTHAPPSLRASTRGGRPAYRRITPPLAAYSSQAWAALPLINVCLVHVLYRPAFSIFNLLPCHMLFRYCFSIESCLTALLTATSHDRLRRERCGLRVNFTAVPEDRLGNTRVVSIIRQAFGKTSEPAYIWPRWILRARGIGQSSPC